MKHFIISLVSSAIIVLFNPATAQQKQTSTQKEQIKKAIQSLKKKQDSATKLITSIKKITDQKVIYRTKIITIRDTVSRIDTCIAIITPIDSATIAVIFKQREPPLKTTRSKKILFIFRKKKQQ